MSVLSNIQAKLTLDNTDFNNKLKQSESKTSMFGSSVTKILGGLAAGFTLSKIFSFTKESLNEFDTAVKARQRLLISLQGDIIKLNQLSKQASDLQRITLFDDDDTLSIQNRLSIALKGNIDQIKILTPLVQDLATAYQLDLTTASDLITGTLFGRDALKKYGIVVEGVKGSLERFLDLQKKVNDAVGGQAAGAVNVGMGKIQQLGLAWGEFKEGFGEMVGSIKIQGEDLITYLYRMADRMKIIGKYGFKYAGFIEQEDLDKSQESAEKLYNNVFDILNKYKGKDKISVTDEYLKIYKELLKSSETMFDIIDSQISTWIKDKSVPEKEAVKYILEIEKYKSVVSSLQAYKRSLIYPTGTGEVTEQIGLIPQIEEKINGLNKVLRTKDTYQEIGLINNQIDDLTKKLEQLKNLKTFGDLDKLNNISNIVNKMTSLQPKGINNQIDRPSFIESRNENTGSAFYNLEGIEALEEAEMRAQQFVNNLNNIVEDGLVSVSASILEGFGAFMITGDLDAYFAGILNAFGNFCMQMGELIMAYGVTMDAFKKAFKNPIAAIAAGAALMVIGGLISTTAQKMMESDGGAGGGYSGGGYQTSSYTTSCDPYKFDQDRDINLTGDFKLKGEDLYISMEKVGKRLNNNS